MLFTAEMTVREDLGLIIKVRDKLVRVLRFPGMMASLMKHFHVFVAISRPNRNAFSTVI